MPLFYRNKLNKNYEDLNVDQALANMPQVTIKFIKSRDLIAKPFHFVISTDIFIMNAPKTLTAVMIDWPTFCIISDNSLYVVGMNNFIRYSSY